MSTRPREDMPDAVASALRTKGLRDAYDARPPYQRNDYLRWIKEAKHNMTRKRRLDQMLAELEKGDVYMKMAWNGGE